MLSKPADEISTFLEILFGILALILQEILAFRHRSYLYIEEADSRF